MPGSGVVIGETTSSNMQENLLNSFRVLFDSVKARFPKAPETKEDWASLAGSITTLAAIFSQGLSAGLLWNDFLTEEVDPNANPTARVISSLIFFAAALAGKFGFIHFCNDASFRSLVSYKWSEMTESKFWTSKKIASSLSALSGSMVFAGLSILNMDKTYDLAREYNTEFCDFLAGFSHSPVLKAIFFMANIGSNMLFFPYANTFFNSTKDSLIHMKRILMEPKYQEYYAEYLNQLAAYNVEMKAQVDQVNGLITAYRMGDETTNINSEGILTALNAIDQKIKANHYPAVGDIQNTRADILARMGVLCLATLCMSGYINFFTITSDMIQAVCDYFNWAEVVGEALGGIAGGIAMISMLAIALIATAGFQSVFMGKLDSKLKTQEADFLTSSEWARVYGRTAITCTLGAFPNGYQSWKLADESPAFVVLALVSSGVSETQGVAAMVSQRFIASSLDKLDDQKKETLIALDSKIKVLNGQAGDAFMATFKQNVEKLPSRAALSWCGCFSTRENQAERGSRGQSMSNFADGSASTSTPNPMRLDALNNT
jgi:hypothetical protein